MITVSGPHPSSSYPADKIIFSHHPQNPLMVNCPALSLELLSYSPVSIPRKLQANSLYFVLEVCLHSKRSNSSAFTTFPNSLVSLHPLNFLTSGDRRERAQYSVFLGKPSDSLIPELRIIPPFHKICTPVENRIRAKH